MKSFKKARRGLHLNLFGIVWLGTIVIFLSGAAHGFEAQRLGMPRLNFNPITAYDRLNYYQGKNGWSNKEIQKFEKLKSKIKRRNLAEKKMWRAMILRKKKDILSMLHITWNLLFGQTVFGSNIYIFTWADLQIESRTLEINFT